jgi:hypothetical protein
VKGLLAVSVALLACGPAAAGELIFANGNRLDGELSNETLMVSTGSGLIEVAPDEISALTRDEVRLRDGRVVQGTLVGGHIKARTSLGEISIKVDDLQSYRASAVPAAGSQPAGKVTASPATAPPAATPPAGPATTSTGVVGGLPTVAAYQDPAGRQPNGPAGSGVQNAVLTPDTPASAGRTYEVVGESVLYRDALFSSSRVGRVAPGQQVRYVDSIDRRLRILNLLVFDGGHWVKIRLADGTEGWVPADSVREVR